ncbi:MAG: hypothetical protein L6R41_008148 [Letrouitia leprolyta]|nr:MAG: hypothetical protein L6R41_008148 [Letrouitia leprolyta]
MLTNMLIQVLLSILSLLPAASPLDCYPRPARTLLPLTEDCQELAFALRTAAKDPIQNTAKEWGRGLPSTDLTEYLPKLYWLPHLGTRKCAITVDADPLFPDAKEVFRLSDIAYGATRLVNVCLIGRREIGRALLGSEGRVVAKLGRGDESELRRLAIGRGGEGGQVRSLGIIAGVGELMSMDGYNETVDDVR